jgi:hypothetical protein
MLGHAAAERVGQDTIVPNSEDCKLNRLGAIFGPWSAQRPPRDRKQFAADDVCAARFSPHRTA